MSDDTRTAPAPDTLTEPISTATQPADAQPAPAGIQPAVANQSRPSTPPTADALVWLGGDSFERQTLTVPTLDRKSVV